jgi:uncharacterized sporulation protein YeaH/YhbH (DUF444 family)
MATNINADVNRFKQIVRNKVKSNLSKYVSSDHILGQQGGKVINVPIDRIDLPRFTYGDGKGNGGASQGDGELGDPMDGGQQQGKGKKAGEGTDEHAYIAEFTAEELAQILGEELQLPKIENKGKGTIKSVKDKYTGISNNGAEGLRHFKRTFKETLKRNISSGDYDPNKPSFIPIKNDKRYRSQKMKDEPDTNSVVIYMMDVSGSMGQEEKHIVKSEVFWIDLWLKTQYKGIVSRFIIHDSVAREVDREQFFTISESGGTSISAAYKLCAEIMHKDHPFSDWNVYPFHFSDGDNWGSDNETSVILLESEIIPNSNVFSYGQVSSGSGEFMGILELAFPNEEKVTLSSINNRRDIMPSIKKFLGKGK